MAFSGSSDVGYVIQCQFCRRTRAVRHLLQVGNGGIIVCDECIGFTPNKKISPREQIIRQSLPESFSSGMPSVIVADWLEEHDRLSDAEYLRKYGKVKEKKK